MVRTIDKEDASGIPAVAYYRMSDDRQTESIKDQRIAVEAFAKQRGYRLIREYADEGISGWKSDQRVEFQRLIADANNGEFQAVLCWDQDRFSRFPLLEANHYWYLLDRAGVHLATVAQGKLDFADLGEWLKASVTQHGKAEYVRDLSRNVCRGMKEKRLNGEWFGPAPYGYVIENRKLVLADAVQVATVRKIFELRLKGYGTHLIAVELNNAGLPTARGARWKSQQVRGILERPTYAGHSLIGKFSCGKFNKFVDEPVLIKNTHEPIIDQESYDRVQAMKYGTRLPNGRGGADAARLSGLIFCGRCSGPMYSMYAYNERSYYRCANYSEGTRRKGQKCGHCAVEREKFEAAVFDRLRDALLRQDRSRIEAAIERELARRATPQATPRGSKREIAKLESQIEKATSQLLLIDADLLPAAQGKLREMRQQLERLQTLPITQKRALPSAKEIADKLWSIDESLRTSEPVVARGLLRDLVSGVVVDFEHDVKRSTPKRTCYTFSGAEIVLRSSESTQLPPHLCLLRQLAKHPIRVGVNHYRDAG